MSGKEEKGFIQFGFPGIPAVEKKRGEADNKVDRERLFFFRLTSRGSGCENWVLFNEVPDIVR